MPSDRITPKNPRDRSLWERDRDYIDTLRTTKDPHKATRAYCAGNKWATENAKAVGNWGKE